MFKISTNFLLLFFIIFVQQSYGQSGYELPILEDFEKDSTWVWKPWENLELGRPVALKSSAAARTGKFGLWFKESGFAIREDIQIGLPGEAISWWVRFQSKTRANCGFGLQYKDYEHAYYLCADPSTNTLHVAKSPDYTYPLLKTVSQTYELN
jgi:hypothetical protein